jgi:hypothetical protein
MPLAVDSKRTRHLNMQYNSKSLRRCPTGGEQAFARRRS